jgi:hypothetical protein
MINSFSTKNLTLTLTLKMEILSNYATVANINTKLLIYEGAHKPIIIHLCEIQHWDVGLIKDLKMF